MSKTTYILGTVLGLLAPVIGVFLGLQVSTTLGNIFAFPIIAVSFVTGTPFGMWSGGLWLLAFALSIAVWIGIVALVSRFFSR